MPLWLLWRDLLLHGRLLCEALQTHLSQFLFQSLDVLLLLCGLLLRGRLLRDVLLRDVLLSSRSLWSILRGLCDVGGRQIDGLRTGLIGKRADLHAHLVLWCGGCRIALGRLKPFIMCLNACERRIVLRLLFVLIFPFWTGQYD